MAIYGYRRRVACYVTRTTEQGHELLVFDHHPDDDPPDNPSGTQIPAGGMLPFEAIEAAALREVREETGLENVRYVEQVGFVEVPLEDPGGPSMTNFVHLEATSDGDASWEHRVTGEGDDLGMTFLCRWEPLPLGFELAGDQGRFLDAVLA
jgi:ADP-ribose pyrophosphatase YjhB (NUDIX family)